MKTKLKVVFNEENYSCLNRMQQMEFALRLKMTLNTFCEEYNVEFTIIGETEVGSDL